MTITARTAAILALTLLLALGMAIAAVAHELEGDRPDVTESALVVPLGSLQIEAGYTLSDYGSRSEQTIGEVLVRYGLLGFLEMRVGFNSYVVTDDEEEGMHSGKDDMSAGLKLQLLRTAAFSSAWAPNCALILGLTFPSGSGGYRGEGPEPRATLCVAWELPYDFHFGSNISLSFPVDDAGRSRLYSASFTIGYTLTERIGLYVEHFLEDPEEGDTSHFADAGIVFGITPDIQLDLRAGKSLNGEDVWFAGAGFIARSLDLF